MYKCMYIRLYKITYIYGRFCEKWPNLNSYIYIKKIYISISGIKHILQNNGLCWTLEILSSTSIYSGPPLMRPSLGNDKSGRIRGVAAGEGEQFYT